MKPKFLYRLHEIGEWFAMLGRKLKSSKQSGIDDARSKERYRELGMFQRELNVDRRHHNWRTVYESVFDEQYTRAITHLHKTENQASKYARQKAEQAVVDAFPDEVTTTRAVRDAMSKFK